MLIQFNFKNFNSFRDDATLDMTATKISEYNNHITCIGGEQILPVAVIFGANASGKSNVLKAFSYMRKYVIDSLSYAGDYDKDDGKFRRPTPFLFDNNTKDAESVFEVYFIDNNDIKQKTYNYGFSIDNEGVCEEWLNEKAKTSNTPKKIFYRNRVDGTLQFSGLNTKVSETISLALEKETLIVSLGARLKIDVLRLVFDNFAKMRFVDFGEPRQNAILSTLIPSDFVDSKDVRKKVVNYFSSFDKSIVDFKTEVIKGISDKEKDKIKIDSVHKMIDGKGYASIPLSQESGGTLKMFALYPWVDQVLTSGGIIFIDELNAKLHPLLVRVFVQMFLNKESNPNNAQLIFTTHDAWQLESDLLRRDEIWFTEKQKNGISTLYSLADFIDDEGNKIRKDENYEKNYLLGKYGAIPTLHSFNFFKGE